MVGICRQTGRPIEEPEHIRQSIDTLLTTPIGSRVMLRDLGFECIDDECRGKPGLDQAEVRDAARSLLTEYEPRATFGDIVPEFDGTGFLQAVEVHYTEKRTGNVGQLRVVFPPEHMRG